MKIALLMIYLQQNMYVLKVNCELMLRKNAPVMTLREHVSGQLLLVPGLRLIWLLRGSQHQYLWSTPEQSNRTEIY